MLNASACCWMEIKADRSLHSYRRKRTAVDAASHSCARLQIRTICAGSLAAKPRPACPGPGWRSGTGRPSRRIRSIAIEQLQNIFREQRIFAVRCRSVETLDDEFSCFHIREILSEQAGDPADRLASQERVARAEFPEKRALIERIISAVAEIFIEPVAGIRMAVI